MVFAPLPVSGAYRLEVEALSDSRGLFARTFCRSEFEKMGLQSTYPQCNTSYNVRQGTLRGMHFQVAPHQEVKIVRCTAGAVFDVIVDLRKSSPTYLKWHAETLSFENRNALYIPAGCAHGFLTLSDHAEVLYMMGEVYHPESARGVRHDDPAFGIQWPAPVAVISDRDAAYADFKQGFE